MSNVHNINRTQREYKGYDLFNGLEDKALQARNRAVVLWNIFESNSKDGRATPKGVSDMIGYTKEIPGPEREDMLEALSGMLKDTKASH